MKTIFNSSSIGLEIDYNKENGNLQGGALRIGNTTIDSLLIPKYLNDLKKAIDKYEKWSDKIAGEWEWDK